MQWYSNLKLRMGTDGNMSTDLYVVLYTCLKLNTLKYVVFCLQSWVYSVPLAWFPFLSHVRCHAVACWAMLSGRVLSALLPVMALWGGGLCPSSPRASCHVQLLLSTIKPTWHRCRIEGSGYHGSFYKFTSCASVACRTGWSSPSWGYYTTEKSQV